MPENEIDLDAYIAVVDAYREADEAVRDWEARKTELREQLLALLGSSDRGRLNGELVVRRTHYNGREYIDVGRLRDTYPEVANRFVAYTRPYDTLTLVRR